MRRGFSLGRRGAALALLGPPLALFLMFFVAPLATLFWASLHGASQTALYADELTLSNYAAILEDPFYHTIILRTLVTGATIVAATLVLGYATAYVIAPLPPRTRLLLLLLLLVPLMVSNVIRAYGWIAILGRQGLVNTVLRGTGIIDRPLLMLNTFEAVVVGLMTILLPYMVISIANALAAIDVNYRDAAQSLRASPFAHLRARHLAAVEPRRRLGPPARLPSDPERLRHDHGAGRPARQAPRQPRLRFGRLVPVAAGGGAVVRAPGRSRLPSRG